MWEPQERKRFNFKPYQHAKKSRKMLIRFILYSIVIGFLFYLILTKGSSSDTNPKSNDIETFEIETE